MHHDLLLQIKSEDGSVEDAYGMAEYKLILKSGLNGICSTTWLVLRLFTILFGRSEGTGQDQKHRDRATILAMLDEGIYHPYQLQDEFPLGVALPLLEAIRRCCLDPSQVDSTVQVGLRPHMIWWDGMILPRLCRIRSGARLLRTKSRILIMVRHPRTILTRESLVRYHSLNGKH